MAYDMIVALNDMFYTQARTESFNISKAFVEIKLAEGATVGPHVIKMVGHTQRLEKLGFPIVVVLEMGGPRHTGHLISLGITARLGSVVSERKNMGDTRFILFQAKSSLRLVVCVCVCVCVCVLLSLGSSMAFTRDVTRAGERGIGSQVSAAKS